MQQLNTLFRNFFTLLGLFYFQALDAQIFNPEGLNMPGSWNSWTNPPSNNLALASATQVSGGRIAVITTGDRRYQTIFNTVSEVPAGAQQFKFTSGGTNPWANEWAQGVSVSMNTFQTYGMGGSNASINLTANRWYTMNWRDLGYTTTTAIFMETTHAPVQITSVTQSPLAANVTPSDAVTVTVTANNSLSPEERLYLRYTTDNFANSTLVQFSMSGNTGTAIIPAQPNGTNVNYYVFSSTLTSAAIGSNFDMASIRINNNGGSNYFYSSTSLPPVNITFRVNMSTQTVGGPVNFAASYNSFVLQPMTHEGGNVYAITVSLPQNQAIEYKFVNNTTYEDNLGAPCGNGINRTYTVPNVNATVPTVCFSSCTDCPPTVPVTFQVDMSQQTVSGNGVHIAGAFQGWNPGSSPMTHIGGNVYTRTFNLVEGQTYQYKFINGNNWGNDENVPGACATSGNRSFTVPVGGGNVPLVCFASCSACPAIVNVTFQVDMSQQTVSADGVHIAGEFQGWNPSASPMTHIGGDIYTRTFALPEGQTFQFKYINGNAWGNDETVPGACNTSGNRTVNVPIGGGSLPVVCFGSCTSCSPIMVNVTFQVDMSQQTVSSNGIHIAGDFQGWNPSASPMTHIGGGIYTRTFSLAQGSSIQYKFINGNAWGNDENVPGACNTSGNRSYTVPIGGGPIAAVCFGSCSACPTAIQSIASGAWESNSTWNTGVVPASGADVTISTGHTVTTNSAVSIGVATINGNLNANENLTINGGGTVAGNLTIASNKVLFVTASTLNSTGLITLKNGASLMHGNGTPGGGGQVTGNFRMERQGFAGLGYSFMSAPMQNVNVATLGTRRYWYNTANGSSIITAGVADAGWTQINGPANMQQALGYAILSPGLAVMNGINPREGTTNITVSAPGGGTNNMNLLGNPFPSAISASAFMNMNGPAGTGAIDGTIYYWDNPTPNSGPYVSSDYATWNGAGGVGGGGNTPNGTIAAGQGIFVRGMIDNQTVSFFNDMRITNNAQFFDEQDIGRARFSINTPQHYNETLIAFLEGATDGFDNRFDSRKFVGNPSLALYSWLNDQRLAIQSFGPLQNSRTVSIGIQSSLNEPFTLRLKELENFDPTISIILEDRELNVRQNLRLNDTYVFTTGSMSLNERIKIHFGAPIHHVLTDASCETEASLTVSSEADGVEVRIINDQEQVVAAGPLYGQYQVSNLAAGSYQLRYLFGDGYQVNQVFEVAAVEALSMLEPLPTFIALSLHETLLVSPAFTGNAQIQWWLNGELLSDATDFYYVFDAPGIYELRWTATTVHCHQEQTITVQVTADQSTGIAAAEAAILRLYPNPASEKAFLVLPEGISGQVQITCYDAAMRPVISLQENNPKTWIELNTETLARGIYFIDVQTQQQQWNTKLVKQ